MANKTAMLSHVGWGREKTLKMGELRVCACVCGGAGEGWESMKSARESCSKCGLASEKTF